MDSNSPTTPLDTFDSLWNYSDPANTERLFRALLPLAESVPDRAKHVELLTQIARTQGLQRQFEVANATLDQAEQLATSEMSRAQIRILLERGRVLNSSGSLAQALPFFEQAWTLAQTCGEDSLGVDAAHMCAIAAPLEQQVEWNMCAIALSSASSDPDARRWKASLANNLGWTYHALQKYDQALELWEAALESRREQGNLETIRMALWTVARCLRSVGRIDDALEQQRELLNATGEADADGFVHEEIAECLTALGKSSEATPHFRRAYERLVKDPWFVVNEPDRLARMKELGADLPATEA